MTTTRRRDPQRVPASPQIEHYVVDDLGQRRRVHSLREAQKLLGDQLATLRQRMRRNQIRPAAWVDDRTPMYYATDLGLPDA